MDPNLSWHRKDSQPTDQAYYIDLLLAYFFIWTKKLLQNDSGPDGLKQVMDAILLYPV